MRYALCNSSVPQLPIQVNENLEDSRESPIVVTRNGRPVAMLIAIEEEDDQDSLLLVHNPCFLQLLEEERQRVRVTGGVPLAEFRRGLETSSPE